MCIIAIKQKGVDFPSIERVQTMCENNSDGFALVWYHPTCGKQVYRTLKMFKFVEKFKQIARTYDKERTTLFIHARIKTHGTLRIENVHGWSSREVGLTFAHNGILSVANRDDLTDSETFFRDIFIPAYLYGGWDAGERTIKAIIGTSKFVFMDNKGKLIHFGTYITGDDGILYSNSTYQPYYYKSYNIAHRSNGWSRPKKSYHEPVYVSDCWEDEQGWDAVATENQFSLF